VTEICYFFVKNRIFFAKCHLKNEFMIARYKKGGERGERRGKEKKKEKKRKDGRRRKKGRSCFCILANKIKEVCKNYH
jgi:hypothetical protein